MSLKNDLKSIEYMNLTNIEYMNLATKINCGAIPVEYFRKNLFSATTRLCKQLDKPKKIYEDEKIVVKVSRLLNQKHRDAMSILFADNKRIIGTINPDGSYMIKLSLYQMAKEMGYKSPTSSTKVILKLLDDLRGTEFNIYNKEDSIETGGHRLIGEYIFNKNTNEYFLNIPSLTSKFKIFSYSVEIDKKLNKRILAIPNKFARIKALVSFLLSNVALRNGISFLNICDKLDIVNENKSRFKKDIKENIELLESFNIFVDLETMIIKYKKLDEIKFHRAIKEEEIKIIEKEKERSSRFVGKLLKHTDPSKKIIISKIIKLIKEKSEDDAYTMELEAADGVITKTKKPISFDMLEDFEGSGFIYSKEEQD